MANEGSTYEARGVSSSKSEVHAAVSKHDPGLFPGAFCKITPDYQTGDADYCKVMHADGSGSKAVLAYLQWKETGDLSVWKGIMQDSLVMNFDDAGCVGALGPFDVTTTIDRNKHRIPGEVIATLIDGCEEFCDKITALGIPCHTNGGETADVGDSVRTITVNNTIICRMRRSDVIDASRMIPGDIIVGFSSTGQANWEKHPNTGIGANGLTSGRHDVLHFGYSKRFPESFAPETPRNLIYRGSHALNDPLPGDRRFTIGSALLSPTRTYLPLIKRLLSETQKSDIHGLIHCSGGGQTKIGKFGAPGNRYVKHNLFPMPPLFNLLSNSETPTKEMYQVYNMGHRLEAVVGTTKTATECIAIANDCGIEGRIVGGVEETPGPQEVRIQTGRFVFTYQF